MFYYITNIAMTNLNTVSMSVEELSKKQEWKVLYIDEHSFCAVHTPKKTETWSELTDKFAKRSQAEQEKLVLKNQKHELVEQHNHLSKELEKVVAQPVNSEEEAIRKHNKIQSLLHAMKEVEKKIVEKEKEIQKKESEIEEFNREILVLADKVREEEHDENKRDQQQLDILKESQIEDLKSQLMAA